MSSSIRYIDLFAGAGGLSEGFNREGYEPIAHIESDLAACYTLKTRQAYYYLRKNNKLKLYYDYLKGIISREHLYSLVPEEIHSRILYYSIGRDNRIIQREIANLLGNNHIDLIIGGPPCQAYSLVGRARDGDNMEGDHRNYLYKEYAKFLERYKPKIFLFENVPGLLSANNGSYFKNMRNLFTKAGYETKHFHLSANNFGVLQNRKRILIIGYRMELKLTLPDFEKFKSDISSEVASIFSDLPVLKAGYPVIEEGLRGILDKGIKVLGRIDGAVPRDGELNPAIVAKALGMPVSYGKDVPALVKMRPPSFCKGCGHADMFNALIEAVRPHGPGRVFSDIGCYTLGAMPPYNAINSCVDMGASVTMAIGAADAGLFPSIAVIGDSTFTHSGMTGLLDAVNKNSPVTIIISDNSTTGMTGGQKSQATGKLEQICLGIGVAREHLRVIIPLRNNHEKNLRTISEELVYKGVSVIISARECIQTATRGKKSEA